MSENKNEAAAPAAKHRGRNTEGSVRVLGQTAAVAGISGALLLALKAMVLVSPAVLPDSDGLDALGRPNAIVDTSDSTAPPVIFAPAANPISLGNAPIGSSERTGLFRSPSAPAPVSNGPSRQVAGETDNDKPATKPNAPSTPGNNTDDDDDADAPQSGVGKVTKPVTDLVDKTLGTDLGKTADDLGDTVRKVPVVGDAVETVTEAAEPVTTPLLETVEEVATPVTESLPVKLPKIGLGGL